MVSPFRGSGPFRGRSPFVGRSPFAGTGPWGDTHGPELVTNGTFDSDTSWTKSGATTISGGVATVASTTAFGTCLSQTVSVINNRAYLVTITATRSSGNSIAVAVGGQTLLGGVTTLGTYTATTTFNGSTGANTLAVIEGNGVSWAGTIDNISVKEAL
jgi:hypothetical protein